MPDLSILVSLLAAAGKYIPVLAGGLNVLNSALTTVQKLLELWEKTKNERQQKKQQKQQKDKNKRSTKRNSMNP